MATNWREPSDYYAAQLEKGQEFQDYIAWRLLAEGLALVNYQSRKAQFAFGENALGLEIKFDNRFEQTDNLWIETAEKRDPAQPLWMSSGIFREDRCWLYGIGNYREFFIFSKKYLQAYRKGVIQVNDRQTSRGYLLPRMMAAVLADRAFIWPDGQKEWI